METEGVNQVRMALTWMKNDVDFSKLTGLQKARLHKRILKIAEHVEAFEDTVFSYVLYNDDPPDFST